MTDLEKIGLLIGLADLEERERLAAQSPIPYGSNLMDDARRHIISVRHYMEVRLLYSAQATAWHHAGRASYFLRCQEANIERYLSDVADGHYD